MSLPRRHLLGLLVGASLAPLVQADAAPAELTSRWPRLRLVGSGRLRYFGLRVYDARLWAPGTLALENWAQQPFALELQYARSLAGSAIAQRSLDEMRRQGALSAQQSAGWLATMTATFPDVREQDRLTGVYLGAEPTRFYFNGGFKAEWADGQLARQFFGIWLSPQTSDPALRGALFGGRA